MNTNDSKNKYGSDKEVKESMRMELSRRRLIGAAAGSLIGLTAAAALPTMSIASSAGGGDYSFLLLGDLHFDRVSDHDMEWLKREHPGDVHQVENYSRVTREQYPSLLSELKRRIDEDPGIAFVTHIGDLVEGLAGTPERATIQARAALESITSAHLGRPFLFCKGNHDVTGPGALDAFNNLLLPFVGSQANQELRTGCFTTHQGDCLFAYYDAYSHDSLDWLEKTLSQRTERHLFVVIHTPVVPYDARSDWHIFSKPAEKPQRDRLLSLLGRNRAIVLCGHLHKYGAIVRQTLEGPFVQVAMISVLPSAESQPRDLVSGIKAYGPELVRLEPNFSPATLTERRRLLTEETPFIRYFDYADAPGYGKVSVSGKGVKLDIFQGSSKTLFRSLSLTDLVSG